DRGEDAARVARARVTPDAAVEAEGEEEDVARDEDRRQRQVEDVTLPDRARALDADDVRDRERRRDQREVDEYFDQPSPVNEQRAEERGRAFRRRRSVHVGEIASELEQERER